LAIWLPGCAIATWWQIGVAESGDSLGWVYSVMWPAFALFGLVFWWFLVHDDPETLGKRGLRRAERQHPGGIEDRPDDAPAGAPDGADQAAALARAEAEDPELAAYNDYLAALAREDRRSSGRSG
jgi:hypothetical protein